MDNAWTSEFQRLREENAVLKDSHKKLVRDLLFEKWRTRDLKRGLEAMVKMLEVGRVNG